MVETPWIRRQMARAHLNTAGYLHRLVVGRQCTVWPAGRVLLSRHLPDADKRAGRAGDNAAQWAYGSYLETENQESEARIWQLRAMHGARDGLDLRGEMLGYCDRIPGFDARTVEGIMLRIAQSSPDAHLRLLQLYIYPGCGAFNLEKASAQIPLLTQCAHLTLVDYLNRAESAHHRVLQPTREAIRSNMAICERELASPRRAAPCANSCRCGGQAWMHWHMHWQRWANKCQCRKALRYIGIKGAASVLAWQCFCY